MDRRHIRRQKIVQQLFAATFDNAQTELPRAEKTDLVLKHLDELDVHITHYAQKYVIDKIAKVDLSILRLAIYELMIERQVPPRVIINEAVELAKAFGGENASKFVNGVLGTIYRKSDFYEPESEKKPKNPDAA